MIHTYISNNCVIFYTSKHHLSQFTLSTYLERIEIFIECLNGSNINVVVFFCDLLYDVKTKFD